MFIGSGVVLSRFWVVLAVRFSQADDRQQPPFTLPTYRSKFSSRMQSIRSPTTNSLERSRACMPNSSEISRAPNPGWLSGDEARSSAHWAPR
jgi:hypothetical protein